MTLKEKFKALMKNYKSITSSNEELKNQSEYLRCQLGESMKPKKKKILASSSGSVCKEDSEEDSNPLVSSSEEELQRRSWSNRMYSSNLNDFRVEISEWLHTVQRVFDYKGVSEAKEVKLIAIKLRKYADHWWTNCCKKGSKNEKTRLGLGRK